MRHLLLTAFLLSAVAFALVRPGPPSATAGEPKPAPPGKGKPEDPPPTPEDAPEEDFFEGETSFSKEQVGKAIEKGMMYLRKRQDGDGSWGNLGAGNRSYGGGEGGGGGTPYTYPAGLTSLALYTLLKCKVPPKDPQITKGFKYLQNKDLYKPATSYEVAMLLLAVCATADPSKSSKASDKKVEKLTLQGNMRKWAQDLVATLKERRKARGWRYQHEGNTAVTPGGEEDISSTQLVSLALFSAHRLGIKVDNGIWEDVLSFTMEQQEETGPDSEIENPADKQKIKAKARGFTYTKNLEDEEMNRTTGSMTACGVGNVMMARFVLTDGGKKRTEWDARPDAAKVQQSVVDGLAWLDTHWSPFANPNKGKADVYHMYWLYSFERMMDLIEMQRVGKHIWYSEMGQQILDRQAENGSWDTQSTHEPRDVLDTCFALLFLKRATKGTIPFPSLTGGSEDPPADNR